MRKAKHALSAAAIAAVCALTAVASGGEPAVAKNAAPEARSFASFRDIPGVTAAEASAVEAFKERRGKFVYGGILSTETFLDENGEVGGYTTIVCRWLTELFGIQFEPAIYDWGDLISGLQGRTIDFSGDFTPTEERRKKWFMTDGVSGHAVKSMRIAGGEPLALIKRARAPRYVFLDGSQTAASVASAADYPIETVFAKDYAAVYALLKSGKADAFVEDGLVEAAFDSYGDVASEEFQPLIFNTTAITTLNPELEPLVSVITKALRNGAAVYLNDQYRHGHDAYKKHKFRMNLNAEEKAYLENTDTVPIVYQYFNYPIAFYDFHQGKWDGISKDILREAEKLTGLTFKVINTEHTEMPELIAMLADGRGHIFCDLIYTEERSRDFIWNKNKFMSDQYALLSKYGYPNVNISEIPYRRVAMIKSTAHEEMFLTWFPTAAYAVSYPNADAAFLALEQDEADLVMVSKSKLLWYANYYEFSGYKANVLFNYFYESAFAFNKDQTILCSIVDKAVSVIETNVITEQWITKTYDFRARLLAAQAQRPWLIGAIGLFVLVLALTIALLFRSRSEAKRLVNLVEAQTATLKKASEEARSASEAKSRFMANMNHEMRTPMNVIVGLTDLALEEDEASPKIKEAIQKINSAGNILMGLINDVLDISKVEAGRLELIPVKYDMASL
jgi:ABC-type amino acid transport substrate-binding protein